MDLGDKLNDALIMSLNNDELILPTLPEVAIKVREVAEDPDASIETLALIISQDPALSARLIRIVNSPLIRGIDKVDNLQAAVSRLGIEFSKNICIGLAMEQIFQATNELIDKKMRESWARSKEIASLTAIFAKHYTSLSVDKASLAGLVHEIGILPILAFLENREEVFDERLLNRLIRHHHPSIGRAILENWQFPMEMIIIPEAYTNYSRETKDGKPDYTDLIQMAYLQLNFGKETPLGMINKEDVKAYGRLKIEFDYYYKNDEPFMSDLASVDEILA